MDWFNKRKSIQQAMKDKSKNIARITGIVDGDSFTASVKGEEKTICVANVDPLGDEGGRAKGFLATLLKVGQRVNLQEFGENNDGETVANVYKGRKGKDIALMMVKKGFAEISDAMEYRTDLEKLSRFELKAQKAGKGIWADLSEDSNDEADDMNNDFMDGMEGIDNSIEDGEMDEDEEDKMESEDKDKEEEDVKDDYDDEGEDSLNDLIDELEDAFDEARESIEDKIDEIDDKLDETKSEADRETLEARIKKLEGKLERLEEEFEEALEKLERSDELTGRGTKASGNPFEGLEISSAELDDGELLVNFSNDFTFQEYDEKRFKAFAGDKKLNLKKAEILDGDLISFEVPRGRKLSDGSVFKMLFTGEGQDKGDVDYMGKDTGTLIAEIEVV